MEADRPLIGEGRGVESDGSAGSEGRCSPVGDGRGRAGAGYVRAGGPGTGVEGRDAGADSSAPGARRGRGDAGDAGGHGCGADGSGNGPAGGSGTGGTHRPRTGAPEAAGTGGTHRLSTGVPEGGRTGGTDRPGGSHTGDPAPARSRFTWDPIIGPIGDPAAGGSRRIGDPGTGGTSGTRGTGHPLTGGTDATGDRGVGRTAGAEEQGTRRTGETGGHGVGDTGRTSRTSGTSRTGRASNTEGVGDTGDMGIGRPGGAGIPRIGDSDDTGDPRTSSTGDTGDQRAGRSGRAGSADSTSRASDTGNGGDSGNGADSGDIEGPGDSGVTGHPGDPGATRAGAGRGTGRGSRADRAGHPPHGGGSGEGPGHGSGGGPGHGSGGGRDGHAAVTWAEAREIAARAADRTPLPPAVRPLADCLGQVLAAPLTALTDLPPFDTSAMDGWAVAGPGPWRTDAGEEGILAGHGPSAPLPDGHAVPIATGARVPPGATAVLRSEYGALERDAGYRDESGASSGARRTGRLLRADRAHQPEQGQDIRPRGQECRAGDLLLPTGTPVTPAVLGLAAAAGYDELPTVPRPRVEVLVVGDELLTSGIPRDGRIRDALGPMIGPWLTALGADLVASRHVADDAETLYEAVTGSVADLVITTGGTAAGPVDHVHPVLRRAGAELLVDGVAVRPGHPMLLARLAPGRHLVGLPGNPLAAVSGLLTLAEPLLRGLTGRAAPASRWVRLAEPVAGHPRDTRLVPVSYHRDRGEGGPSADRSAVVDRGGRYPAPAGERTDPTGPLGTTGPVTTTGPLGATGPVATTGPIGTGPTFGAGPGVGTPQDGDRAPDFRAPDIGRTAHTGRTVDTGRTSEGNRAEEHDRAPDTGRIPEGDPASDGGRAVRGDRSRGAGRGGGRGDTDLWDVWGVLTGPAQGRGERRGRVAGSAKRGMAVVPLRFNGPAMLRGVAMADAVAVIPPGGARRGTEVETLELPWATWTAPPASSSEWSGSPAPGRATRPSASHRETRPDARPPGARPPEAGPPATRPFPTDPTTDPSATAPSTGDPA
ncbi:molybdopterin-binding protein [Streptomyces pactum]|uniref:molybdopterin-binding protein n=1 Tax=Streptomyces pactum TaxID=68249 RepID=UPI0035566968